MLLSHEGNVGIRKAEVGKGRAEETSHYKRAELSFIPEVSVEHLIFPGTVVGTGNIAVNRGE